MTNDCRFLLNFASRNIRAGGEVGYSSRGEKENRIDW